MKDLKAGKDTSHCVGPARRHRWAQVFSVEAKGASVVVLFPFLEEKIQASAT